MRRRFWFLLATIVLAGTSAAAQKAPKVPKRPKLAAYADTNDAAAYWRHGQSKLVDDPWEAGDAFYWAIQINPIWADGYYGRWVAKYLEDPQKWDGLDNDVPEMMQVDSLMLRARTLNPFLFERLRRTMIEQEIAKSYPAGVTRGAVEIALASAWNADPYHRAISAYTRGNFAVALAGYDTTITEIEKYNKDNPGKGKDKDRQAANASRSVGRLHLQRGRIFYLAGNFESASVELAKAVAGLQVADKKQVVPVYDSKAIVQQSIGLTYERLHMPDSAKEAYGRALQEDLSYAPAHLSLASLALSDGDTTVALSELETAAQMSPNDPATAFFYGRALITAGKDKEAVEQLKRCTALDPYFANPHVLLALMYDASDYKPEALAEFKAYLSLAAANDPYIAQARERVAALSAEGKP